jgi:hypothetical protein
MRVSPQQASQALMSDHHHNANNALSQFLSLSLSVSHLNTHSELGVPFHSTALLSLSLSLAALFGLLLVLALARHRLRRRGSLRERLLPARLELVQASINQSPQHRLCSNVSSQRFL